MMKFLGRISTRRWLTSLVTLAVLILLVGGSLWYTKLYMNKERRFWTAIENSLRTSSVTKEILREDQNGSQLQQNRFRLGKDASNEGRTILVDKSTIGQSSTVATSSLMTRNGSFVKYDKIETSQKNSQGQNFDFSNVIGQWASQYDAAPTPYDQGLAESFVQLIPIASLNVEERRQVIQALKDQGVFEVNYNNASDNDETGFTVYDVTLHTKAYVKVLQDIFAKQGFTQLEALDPEQYSEDGNIGLQIHIDDSNSVRRVSFGSAADYESYGGYGITEELKVPQEVIRADELQKRLQSAQ